MSNIEEGSKKEIRGPNYNSGKIIPKELDWETGCPFCGKLKSPDGKQEHETNCDFMSRVMKREKYYKEAGLTLK